MNKKYSKKYEEIITFQNILEAWENFKKGKTKRKDVNDFEIKILENLHSLYTDLKNKTYKHSNYEKFEIVEVKKREIHKATVRDRIVHQLIYSHLYSYFDQKFIYDSYSCRQNKGTHKALLRYEKFFRKSTRNFTKQTWVLKFDIKKCFEDVNQSILLKILEKQIEDKDILELCKKVIFSFDNDKNCVGGGGLPLGNLTSQLFINVYLNELDRFCKHILKIKYYIRYADDVVIFYNDFDSLQIILHKINTFLQVNLKLTMHKVSINTVYHGVDFLGFKHFKYFRTLRKVTERKMFKNLSKENVSSYLGMLEWGSCYNLKTKVNLCWN